MAEHVGTFHRRELVMNGWREKSIHIYPSAVGSLPRVGRLTTIPLSNLGRLEPSSLWGLVSSGSDRSILAALLLFVEALLMPYSVDNRPLAVQDAKPRYKHLMLKHKRFLRKQIIPADMTPEVLGVEVSSRQGWAKYLSKILWEGSPKSGMSQSVRNRSKSRVKTH